MKLPVLCALVAAVAGFNAADYTHTSELTPGYSISWKVDSDTLHLALRAKTTGWLGFGISDPAGGGMKGADIVTGFVKDDGTATITDSYALKQSKPLRDESQDWTLVGGEEVDDETIIELTRLLDTGDTQDRVITLDRHMKVIIAWGSQDFVLYHQANRLATSVHFGQAAEVDLLAAVRADPDVFEFELLNDHAISARQTDYVVEYFDLPGECSDSPRTSAYFETNRGCSGTFRSAGVDTDTACTDGFQGGDTFFTAVQVQTICRVTCKLCTPEPFYLVGIEHILQESTDKFVHHFVMSVTHITHAQGSTLYAWAQGVDSLVPPEECAFLIGGDSGIAGLELNTHYDNPTGQKGPVDRSGVRLFFSRKPRKYNCGQMSLGDPKVSWIGKQLKDGPTVSKFECDVFCDEDTFQEIHVFGSFLHMHLVGKRIWSEVHRDGKLLEEFSRNDFYDSRFESMTPMNVDLKKGDILKSTCVHDGSGDVIWGAATQDEMCIEFVYYYPEINGGNDCGVADACGKGVGQFDGSDADYTPRLFGKARGLSCGDKDDVQVCSDGSVSFLNHRCEYDSCFEPTCDDLVQNGDETDVDCGGSCKPCGSGNDNICSEDHSLVRQASYVDPSTNQATNCGNANDFCVSNIEACGGDLAALAGFFSTTECCEALTVCPDNLELVRGATYQFQGQDVVCGDSNDLCIGDISQCGGNLPGLQQFFATTDCCALGGTDGEGDGDGDADVVPHGRSKEGCDVEGITCTEVQANGFSFSCRTAGPADGIPVMFLHGFPEWSIHFQPLLLRWVGNPDNKLHGVACDLRGYSEGASPADSSQYNYDLLASDVWALADALKFERFHLVGHDHGAALGWLVASQDTAQTRLLSYSAMAVPHLTAFNTALAGAEASAEQIDASNYFNQLGQEDLFSYAAAAAALGTIDVTQTMTWWYFGAQAYITRPEVLANPTGQFSALAAQLYPIEPRAAIPASKTLGDIEIPTMMFCGTLDPYLLCSLPQMDASAYVSGPHKQVNVECQHSLMEVGEEACKDEEEVNKVFDALEDFLTTALTVEPSVETSIEADMEEGEAQGDSGATTLSLSVSFVLVASMTVASLF